MARWGKKDCLMLRRKELYKKYQKKKVSFHPYCKLFFLLFSLSVALNIYHEKTLQGMKGATDLLFSKAIYYKKREDLWSPQWHFTTYPSVLLTEFFSEKIYFWKRLNLIFQLYSRAWIGGRTNIYFRRIARKGWNWKKKKKLPKAMGWASLAVGSSYMKVPGTTVPHSWLIRFKWM